MESSQTITSPFVKTIRWTGLYLGLSVAGLILLVFVAIYVPNQYLLRRLDDRLADWLPNKGHFIPGMILVDESKITNDSVSNNSNNPEQMLARLKNFGRLDGHVWIYRSEQPCAPDVLHLVRIGIILHQNADGAQNYLAWTRSDLPTGYLAVIPVNVGLNGFLVHSQAQGSCSRAGNDNAVSLSFSRNNALGTVVLTASADDFPFDQLQVLALDIARRLDEHIIEKTGVP